MTTTASISYPAGITTDLPDLGVYVACLASYNSGKLYGSWVDLTEATTAEEIQEAIDFVLKNSPAIDAEEYAIHDSCGLPRFLMGEWPSLESLAEFAEVVTSLDSDEAAAYRVACNNEHTVIDEDSFRDSFCGIWGRPEKYAEQLAEDCGDLANVPSYLISAIDWESVWVDMSCGSYWAEYIDGEGYAVFSH